MGSNRKDLLRECLIELNFVFAVLFYIAFFQVLRFYFFLFLTSIQVCTGNQDDSIEFLRLEELKEHDVSEFEEEGGEGYMWNESRRKGGKGEEKWIEIRLDGTPVTYCQNAFKIEGKTITHISDSLCICFIQKLLTTVCNRFPSSLVVFIHSFSISLLSDTGNPQNVCITLIPLSHFISLSTFILRDKSGYTFSLSFSLSLIHTHLSTLS